MSPRSGFDTSLLVRSAVVAFLALGACGGERRQSPDASAPRGPVERPASVLAVVAVHDLAETFGRARTLGGALIPSALRAAEVRAVAAALAGLEPGSREAIDPHGTAFVIAIQADPVVLAYALPLVAGAAAPALSRDGTGVGTRVSGFFVAAPDGPTLRSLVPWVTRTLATRSWPADLTLEVEAGAARGFSELLRAGAASLAVELRAEARAAREAMGRAPEVGEPEAVASWLEELAGRVASTAGDASLRATVDLVPEMVAIGLRLEARAGSLLAASMAGAAPGEIALLGRIPSEAALALAVRRSPPERRAESTRTLELLQRIAGPRIAFADLGALREVAARWDDASGPETAMAWIPGPQGHGLYLLSAAVDPSAAASSLDDLADCMGRGYLALLGERSGVWRGAASPSVDGTRTFRAPPDGPFGDPWTLRVTSAEGHVLATAGPAATPWHDRPPEVSVLASPPLAALPRATAGKRVALGVLSPARLMSLLEPLAGDSVSRRLSGLSLPPLAWSVALSPPHLEVDLRWGNGGAAAP